MTDWLNISDPDAPERAAGIISAGGLVVLPTDTVYGVAADWRQPAAVAALYAAKQRPPDKAVPLLLAAIDSAGPVVENMTAVEMRLARAFWPGPLTIVLPKSPAIPEIVSSLPTVGVRIPDHNRTRAVIKACGGALAVTSANISGSPEAHTAQEAASTLGDAITLILDGGRTPGGVPSTVVDVRAGHPEVLRAGPITLEALQAAAG